MSACAEAEGLCTSYRETVSQVTYSVKEELANEGRLADARQHA
jgi:hypothetical protein